MIKPRRSAERGFFDHGWLKTWHTFPFADYVDPAELALAPGRAFARTAGSS